MKKIFRALPLLLCLCLIVSALVVPVSAVQYLKPSDYLAEVTADGNIKTAHYSFRGLDWLITAWNSTTGVYEDYSNDVYYFPDVSYKQALFQAYPFGGPVYGNSLPWNSVAFDVSDILPGSPIDFEFPFYVRARWDTYEHVDVSVSCSYGMAYYDKNGNLQNTIYGASQNFSFTMDNVVYKEWEEKLTISGTIPASAYYIVPFVKVDTVLSEFVPDMQIFFGGGSFDLYIDVNTVIENSNMMQSINKKLDDIVGALNGDANVDTSVSDFSGASDTLNNAMQSAGSAMNAGSDSVADIANSSVMAGTLASLGSGLAVAFSDEFKVNLCGMSFNPFSLWVTVIGGFSLIALMVAYIFRKRGGS